MKRLTQLIVLCLVLVFQLPAQNNNSLLWKVSSKDGQKVSYLFGTYHLVGSDYMKEHPKVNKVFEKAQTVVVEAILDSSAMLTMGMKGMMIGHSLRALMDSNDYQMVNEAFQKEVGMGLAQLDVIKPILIATMYSGALAQRLTPESIRYAGNPIDMYIAEEAKRKQKEVVALESIEEQADILFNSQSIEEQVRDLIELIKEKEEAETLTLKIVQAYSNENIQLMADEAQKMEEAYGDMDILLDQRNLKWIKSLQPLLNKGQTFIAVGALHLPGEKGLIRLLEEQGYQLSPVF